MKPWIYFFCIFWLLLLKNVLFSEKIVCQVEKLLIFPFQLNDGSETIKSRAYISFSCWKKWWKYCSHAYTNINITQPTQNCLHLLDWMKREKSSRITDKKEKNQPKHVSRYVFFLFIFHWESVRHNGQIKTTCYDIHVSPYSILSVLHAQAHKHVYVYIWRCRAYFLLINDKNILFQPRCSSIILFLFFFFAVRCSLFFTFIFIYSFLRSENLWMSTELSFMSWTHNQLLPHV